MTQELKRYRLRHRTRPLDVTVTGDGPALVLLHGWGLSGRAYEGAMLALADRGYRVVAPSLAVADDWSIPGVAEQTAEAMAGVDAGPAPIVGHSFGGVIGAHVALHHTDFVTSLVAVSSPLVSLGSVRIGRIMLPGAHYRIVGHAPAAAALLRSAASRRGIPSLLRSARWFLGSGQDAAMAALAETPVPCAIVWAEQDSIVPMEVGARAAEILDCPFLIITADDHWPGKRPPDHDWPFRYPAHFAATIDHVLETAAVPRELGGEDILDR